MPWTVKDVDSHIKGLTDKQKATWVKVANDALKRCEKEGKKNCDASAIKQANSVVKKAEVSELTKKVGSRTHDRTDFLVLGDPDEVGTWHLPVKVNGKPDHRLMGAAHAALHKGYRGNKYEGPDRMKAIRKLDKLYKDEELEVPSAEGAALSCAEMELEQAYAELELNRLGLLGAAREVRMAFMDKYPVGEGADLPLPPYMVRDVYLSHPDWGDVLVVEEFLGERMFLVPFEFGEEITIADPPWQEVRQSYITLGDTQENTVIETVEFAESSLGRIVSIVSTAEAEPGTAPLILDIIPIMPGWGNTRDNNYYPLETLVEFASIWEGAKMYTTDHVDGEKSVRTEVSQVLKSPSGFTDDGVPLARVGIFDEDFAQQVRNRAELGVLDGLHNSIQAGGTAETGFELDGRKGQRVIAFDKEGAGIDWVTRAGAGGKALRIVESKTEGNMSEAEKKQEEELAAAVAAEKVAAEKATEEQAPVKISEDAPKPDPILAPERVKELVEATNLPELAKERVITVGAADEAELQTRIEAEIKYVKALTGSGKPNMPPSQSVTEAVVTQKEVDKRRSEVNAKWLRTKVPAGSDK